MNGGGEVSGKLDEPGVGLAASPRYSVKSIHFGAAANLPLSTAGSGVPSPQMKSLLALSQPSVPSVTAIKSVSALLNLSQYSTSLLTQCEAADVGDESKIR